MSSLGDFFAELAEGLQVLGINVSAGVLQGIFFVILAAIAVSVLRSAGSTTIEAVKGATAFVRKQISNKFWRDAGKLATLISFLLLVIAYGFYGHEQTQTLGAALLDLGRERLAEIVPTAILTQVLLLCAYWLTFGWLTAVPARTLAEPFPLFLGFIVVFAWLLLASVVPFVLADGDPSALGMAIIVMITVFGLAIPLFTKLVLRANKQSQQGRARPAIIVAVVALLMLTGLVATSVACAYAAMSPSPSVGGLVATDFAIMTVLLLFTCYKFRAYIGGAEVPSAIPHLIDFSLAISACAIALVSLPGSEVTLGGIPPVIIAAGPALVVAAMIFIIHLRRSQSGTPRWSACLAVAVVGGLLAGPLKALLTGPLAAFADLLPVNWG